MCSTDDKLAYIKQLEVTTIETKTAHVEASQLEEAYQKLLVPRMQ
jgi:hypothetical protein